MATRYRVLRRSTSDPRLSSCFASRQPPPPAASRQLPAATSRRAPPPPVGSRRCGASAAVRSGSDGRQHGRSRRVVASQEHLGDLRCRAEHIGQDVRLGRAPSDAVRQEAGRQDVRCDGDPRSTPAPAVRGPRPRCAEEMRRRTQAARHTNRCAATPARFLRSLRSPPGPWTPPRPGRPRSRTCRRASNPPRTAAVPGR